MQINFQGQYDKDLFYKAVALANRPPKNRQRLLSVLLVIAIGAIALIGYRLITSGDWARNFVYLAAAIFMGGYVTYFFLRPYFTARKLWANPNVHRPLKGTVNDIGIHYSFLQGGIDIAWKDFNRLQKTDDLVTLIRKKDGLLVIFPLRFFKSNSNWQNFCGLVERKVTPIDEKGIQRPARSK